MFNDIKRLRVSKLAGNPTVVLTCVCTLLMTRWKSGANADDGVNPGVNVKTVDIGAGLAANERVGYIKQS